MKCRLCSTPLHDVFLDLGSAPPSNAYLTAETLNAPEAWFPLKLYTCASCLLVQVDEVQSHQALFPADYAYFSSYSSSWLEHARAFVDAATDRLGLGHDSLVLEVAFEGLQRSPRHRSGLAMRFPRIHRIRWDKPAREANTITDVMALLDAIEGGGGRVAKSLKN